MNEVGTISITPVIQGGVGAIDMPCTMTCPKSLQWLMDLNPGSVAPVFTPTLHCLRKLDFPGNADQGHRTDHRKQEDPEEVLDRAPIELILQPPYFREGN